MFCFLVSSFLFWMSFYTQILISFNIILCLYITLFIVLCLNFCSIDKPHLAFLFQLWRTHLEILIQFHIPFIFTGSTVFASSITNRLFERFRLKTRCSSPVQGRCSFRQFPGIFSGCKPRIRSMEKNTGRLSSVTDAIMIDPTDWSIHSP